MNHFLGEICKVVKIPGQDFSKGVEMWCFKESYGRSAKLVDGGTYFCFEFSHRTFITVYHSTSPDAQCVGQLKEEKISNQSTISNLQKQLIYEKYKSRVKLRQSRKRWRLILQFFRKKCQFQKNVASTMTMKKLGEAVKQAATK